MKFSRWIGVGAMLMLVISCFLNWTWYSDIQQYFTGLYSYNNIYGRPGKLLILLAAISIIFFLVPRLWAKRWNIFVCAITLSWGIRCLIIFSTCYRGLCPQRQAGIWLMVVSASIAMIAALFPDARIPASQPSSE